MRKLALLPVFLVLAPTCEEAPAKDPAPLSDCTTRDGDPFDYGAATTGTDAPRIRIEGDTLIVPIGHAGGCAEHSYVVCWPTQGFSKSLPPQADLEIWHDANGDSCEAYLSVEVRQDLTELAEAHADQFGTGDPRMQINIGGESVEYAY